MSTRTGREQTLSVGDTGLIRLRTYQATTSAVSLKIKIYTLAAFEADPIDPVPLKSLDATPAAGGTGGSPYWDIEAVLPVDTFATEGWYVVRSYMELSGVGKIHGAPKDIYVIRGSG